MPLTEDLEGLIDGIIVSSFREVDFLERRYSFGPFNVGKIAKKIEAAADEEYKKRVPHPEHIVNSLDALSASVREVGGITREIYETHHVALNAIARTLTGTDTKISGGRYNLAKDDASSGEVGEGFKSIEDGRYGEVAGGCSSPNIHGYPGEGTLFQREYDAQGMLETFRVFHQLHRNSLIVGTVDLDQLMERVDKLIRERDAGRKSVDMTLPYDADTFAYEKLIEFNDAFGEYVTLNVLGIGTKWREPCLIAEFKDPHREVAQDLMDLEPQHGIIVKMNSSAEIRTTLWREEGIYRHPLDFYEREDIDKRNPQNTRLDNTDPSISTYLLLGNNTQHFAPMLKAYLAQKMEE